MGIVRRICVASTAALVAASLTGVPAAQAAPVVSCGQTITSSITLANDVGPCPGDGIVVAASNITVNLSTHTVRGLSETSGAIDQAGIRLDNVSGVTLRGGTVRDFFAGVLVKGGGGNTVTGVKATHNIGLGSTVYGDGIVLDGSTGNKVTTNTVTSDGPYSGIDLVHGSVHNLVNRNYLADNNIVTPNIAPGGGPLQADDGITAQSGSSFNTYDGNTVLRSGFFGISLADRDIDNDTTTHNTIRDSGNIGINAGGNGGHFIANNLVDHNGFEQFGPSDFAGLDFGIGACGTCFNPGPFDTIQDNTVTNNKGQGIALLFNGNEFSGGCGNFGCFPGSPFAAPRSHLVQRNTVVGNTGDGIYIACDMLFDANFNSTCLTDPPAHVGMRVLNNSVSRNGGAGAGTTAWDLHDGNPNCGFDIWHGNHAGTGNPPCTLAP